LADPKKRKEYDEGGEEGTYEEGDFGEGQNSEGFDFGDLFEKHFGGMDADDIQNFDNDDDSNTINMADFFGNDNDDDNDGWSSVTWSSDDGFKSKKKAKKSKKQKKKVTLKSDFNESKVDDTDLPGKYFGPYIKIMTESKAASLKTNVWVVILFNDKSDFSSKNIKNLNTFAYNYKYVTVLKLDCSKNKASKKICKTFKYDDDEPQIYIYGMYDEKPRIISLYNFTIAKLKAKIIESFEDYEF